MRLFSNKNEGLKRNIIKNSPKKIAIIGSGISGLTAALNLYRDHDLYIFEADDHIGGHVHTHALELNESKVNVDTGFIVFNEGNYPNFTRLIKELDIPVNETSMSFSYADEDKKFALASHFPSGIFPSIKCFFSFQRWLLILEILRFFRKGKKHLHTLSEELSLKEFCQTVHLTSLSMERYILPMVSAIWSVPLERASQFPAKTILTFFNNHGLLSAFNQPQWKTIKGGSRQYVDKMVLPFLDRIHLNTPVVKVEVTNGKPVVIDHMGQEYPVDHVIFACHSDQVLKTCTDLTPGQRKLLGKITYQENHVVLHQDDSLMPGEKKCWASWNVVQKNGQVLTTYWMNKLQNISHDIPLFVTLNYHGEIKNVFKRMTYMHPVFDHAAIKAQQFLHEVQGYHNFWFCGAYMRYGFHEDGMYSALKMLEVMRTRL